MLGREDKLPPATQARINASLASIDQLLLDPQGLPGRPWYKNLVYAPGTLTGYGAKTLPGVREAIEQRRWDDARAYVGRTAAVIEAYANRLDEVAAMGRHGVHDHRPDDRARRGHRAAGRRRWCSTAAATRRASGYGNQGAVILLVIAVDHGASTHWAGSTTTRARPRPNIVKEHAQ